MASLAWVEVDLRCPACDAPVTDLMWMAWGGVISSNASYGPTYRLGSRILWFLDDHGTAPADARWSRRVANLGDPALPNVDVLTDRMPGRCGSCGLRIDRGRVRILNHTIVSAHVVQPGEVEPTVEAIVLDPVTHEPIEMLESQVLRQLGSG